MSEHVPSNPDYMDRPHYKVDNSPERHWQLTTNVEMLDDLLKAPISSGGTLTAETVPGVGVKVNREFSYQNEHDDYVMMSLSYETNAILDSDAYDVLVDTYIQTPDGLTLSPIPNRYRLHKSQHHVTLAQVETIDLENGGWYQPRRMSAYDGEQLNKELIDCSLHANQQSQENN